MVDAVLCTATLPELADRRIDGSFIEIPAYPRRFEQRIVHLGAGRFHRAHQAAVLHRLLQQNDAAGWGLCVVGLRDADRPVLDALRAQDGLYTLTETDGCRRRVRVIGSIMQWVDGAAEPDAVTAVIADAATRIVSLTVTEAGYCLDGKGRLDRGRPEIVQDLAPAGAPRSVPGWLVRALAARRSAGNGGLTLLSCDNLLENGKRLRSAVLDFARLVDVALADWIDGHCRFPCSMVDRITPAADAAREQALRDDLQLHDAAAVLCEDWLQWILEDDFAAGRPPFERAGVMLSGEVPVYEALKVGLLNGGHSAISHLGLLRGHVYVHDALGDSVVRDWLQAYLRDVAEVLRPPHGVDVDAYCATLIRRFANAALQDTLLRLAQDSSAKFRQTLLPVLRQRIKQNLPIDIAARTIALWIHYLAGLADDGSHGYRDIAAPELLTLARDALSSCEPRAFVRAALLLQDPALDLFSGAIRAQLRRTQQTPSPVVANSCAEARAQPRAT